MRLKSTAGNAIMMYNYLNIIQEKWTCQPKWGKSISVLFSNPSVFEKSANCCLCTIVMFYVSLMLSDGLESCVEVGNICLF